MNVNVKTQKNALSLVYWLDILLLMHYISDDLIMNPSQWNKFLMQLEQIYFITVGLELMYIFTVETLVSCRINDMWLYNVNCSYRQWLSKFIWISGKEDPSPVVSRTQSHLRVTLWADCDPPSTRPPEHTIPTLHALQHNTPALRGQGDRSPRWALPEAPWQWPRAGRQPGSRGHFHEHMSHARWSQRLSNRILPEQFAAARKMTC